VFDDAASLALIDLEEGHEVGREIVVFPDPVPVRKAFHVAELGADVLICGGISRPLERMVSSRGVRVIPRICGSVDDVTAAFLHGGALEAHFSMPGARRACRRRFRGHGEAGSGIRRRRR